ncbi:uncharacterized protein L201_007879 [Kwoniella dendrophila CBS 6074]|uniref:Uncharacterized protein n=1 Tax=Kwoniella dendrophila CBS 6074 TaxID=1295534 RepID=A0AAX4K5R8_9TREE
MSSSPSTPSTGNRSNRPPPLEHINSHHSQTPSRQNDDPPSSGKEKDSKTANSGGSSMSVQFPGGLYLPAVKGTIGGIESPRKHMRNSPSISTLREGQSSTPTSFNSMSTPTAKPSDQEQEHEGEEIPEPPPYSKAIFRSDPTIKSCLTGLKMDRADEIARLFGAT